MRFAGIAAVGALVGSLVACTPPEPDPGDSVVSHAAAPSPAAPPRVEERVFEGPRSGCTLRVRSELPSDETGTMHYADRVVLSVGPGAPVELVTDLEAGTLAPIVARAIDLGGAYLVLGHASWGSGTQTITALVVEGARCGGLSLVARLDVTSRRGGAGLLVDPASASVGIPTALLGDPELAVTLNGRPLGIESHTHARRATAEWVGVRPGTAAAEAAAEEEAVWLAAGPEGLEAAL